MKSYTMISEGCPYQNILKNMCIASLSFMPLDRMMRSKYCSTEDHDACPIFLSKLLRNHN
jgi:hypothetical protein